MTGFSPHHHDIPSFKECPVHLRSSSGARAGLMATLGVLLAFLFIPAGANAAGTYKQYFCDSGYPNPTASGGFTPTVWFGDLHLRCDQGLGIYYNQQVGMLDGYGTANLRANAPAGARYTSLETDLHIAYQDGYLPVHVADDQGWAWHSWDSGPGTTTWNDTRGKFSVAIRNSTFFDISQSCWGTTGGSCGISDFALTHAIATLYDSTPPVITPKTSGVGLFDVSRSAFRGTVSAIADVVDTGKGPQNASVLVDGVAAASDSWPDSSCNFRNASPCANRLGWSKAINTASFSDGPHTVGVGADDGLGNIGTSSPRTVTFDNTAPVMGSLPAINGKTVSAASVDIPISATDATTGVARLEYIWNGAWKVFSNANTGTITVTGAGTHNLRIRAIDAVGNVSNEQTMAVTLQAPPTNQRLTTHADTPMPGAPGPGDTIKCDVGTPWTAGTTFTYEWLRDGAVINGATSQSYTLVLADAARQLRCRVTAHNEAGPTEVTGPAVTAGMTGNYGGTGTCVGQPTGPKDPCGDFDGDGVPNYADPDIDGDNVPNDGDANPYDPSVGIVPRDPGDKGGPAPEEGGNGGGSRGSDTGAASGVLTQTQNGQGPTATATLAAAFDGTKSKTIKVKWGAKRKITGTLLGRDGKPVVGAKLDVTQTPQLMGATAASLGQVVTDAKGRFAYQLPAGQSRTIRFAYKSILEASTYAQTTDVTVQVTPKVTMKANRKSLRNKQAVTFKGKIAGAPTGVRKIVEFQALDGKKWRTFASTRVAKKGGTFKYRYRFLRTTRPTNYQFRAIVRAEKGWPFATGQTKPIKVKVRP